MKVAGVYSRATLGVGVGVCCDQRVRGVAGARRGEGRLKESGHNIAARAASRTHHSGARPHRHHTPGRLHGRPPINRLQKLPNS